MQHDRGCGTHHHGMAVKPEGRERVRIGDTSLILTIRAEVGLRHVAQMDHKHH